MSAEPSRPRSRRTVLGWLAGAPLLALAGPALSSCDDGGRHVVEMTDINQYQPSSLTVRAGDVVTWKNVSSRTHSVTNNPDAENNPSLAALSRPAPQFDSGPIYAGRSWSRQFNQPGRYVYYSAASGDSGMLGNIVVLDS
jgi:plastocyanin